MRQYKPFRYKRPDKSRNKGGRKLAGIIILLSISIISVSVFAYSNGSLPELDDIRESFETEIGNFSEDMLEEHLESVPEMKESEGVGISEDESKEPTESKLEVDENADVVISEDESNTESAEQIQDANKIVKDEPTRAENNLDELRVHMLDSINAERKKAGLGTVKLGENTAAQDHADNMLENCFSGHWGVDGIKPYMRYSLAGGYQNNAENVSGRDYCIKSWENYLETQPNKRVTVAMSGLMSSPGHRDNILDPHHKFVNIGISWDKHNMQVVQHFEYDYVTFFKKPSITDGILSFTITTKNGAIISDDSSVVIYYDQPPRTLTRGQVANTYCYDWGLTVSLILEPPPPGSHYPNTSYQQTRTANCIDPYNTSPNTPAPNSVESAHAAHKRAKEYSQNSNTSTNVIPYIIADSWDMTQNRLNLSADISSILEKHGSGVYTVIVWGTAKGKDVPISSSSLFHTAN